MSDLYDFAHGLLTHPIDTLTGKLDPPNAPKAYTKTAAATKNTASSGGISDQSPGGGNVAGGSVGADFDKKISDAVDAASK